VGFAIGIWWFGRRNDGFLFGILGFSRFPHYRQVPVFFFNFPKHDYYAIPHWYLPHYFVFLVLFVLFCFCVHILRNHPEKKPGFIFFLL